MSVYLELSSCKSSVKTEFIKTTVDGNPVIVKMCRKCWLSTMYKMQEQEKNFSLGGAHLTKSTVHKNPKPKTKPPKMKCSPHCENNPRICTTELPWGVSKTWKLGDWYPMPMGYMERDQEEYIIEGYMIYELQDKESGDIKPVLDADPMIFSNAILICEARNGRRMLD